MGAVDLSELMIIESGRSRVIIAVDDQKLCWSIDHFWHLMMRANGGVCTGGRGRYQMIRWQSHLMIKWSNDDEGKSTVGRYRMIRWFDQNHIWWSHDYIWWWGQQHRTQWKSNDQMMMRGRAQVDAIGWSEPHACPRLPNTSALHYLSHLTITGMIRGMITQIIARRLPPTSQSSPLHFMHSSYHHDPGHQSSYTCCS